MTVSASLEVYGMKDALRELNSISQKLRKEVTKEYAQIMEPVINDARSSIPTQAPLSGMDQQWKTKSGYLMLPGKAGGGWSAVVAQKMVKAKINTKRIKDFGGQRVNVGTFRLVWQGAGNTVFDMAGRKSGNPMARNLEARFGKASRVVWPAYERNATAVEAGMLHIVEFVSKIVSRNLQATARKP